MEAHNIILSSSLNTEETISVLIDGHYVISDALNLTILETNDIAELVSIEKYDNTTQVNLRRNDQNHILDLNSIRLTFIDKLIENQVRYECMNRFSVIRDKIFTAAFKPIEMGK